MAKQMPVIDFKNNKQQLIILISLVAIIIVVLYFNFLLRPQVSRVIGMVMKAGRMSADLKNAERDIAGIDKLRRAIELNKGRIDRYEKMLPVEQEIPGLLEELSIIAKSSGVKIESITPVMVRKDASRKGQVYQEIPIRITARCGYHELGSFLASVDSSTRFMKVMDIEIKGSKTSASKHDVELLVISYVLLDGK